MRLLIAEDDQTLSHFLCRGLCGEGDEVAVAHDGEAALELFLEREPDLMLLDLQLPRRSGHQVLAAIRELSPLCPVLVLSGIAVTEMRISCLEMGADDCMAKPFSLGELRARCGAMLRRSRAARALAEDAQLVAELAGPPVLNLGSLKMHRLRRQIELDGTALHLTNREFALLEQLMLARGGSVARAELRRRVWAEAPVEANVVDVHLASLRRKLGTWSEAPSIETVRGVGFRLAAVPVRPIKTEQQ